MTEEARDGAAQAAAARPGADQVGLLDETVGLGEGRGDLGADDLRRPSENSIVGSSAFNDPDAPMDPVDNLPSTDDELPPSLTSDNLTLIDGVGEATAQKLHDAGLNTYTAIAGASLAQLNEVLGSKSKDIQKKAKKLTR